MWSLDVLKQSLCSTLAVVCVAPRLSLRGRACASSQMEGRGSKCSLFILALSNEMFTREPKMFARRAIVSPPHSACFLHSVCADVSLRVSECVEPPQSFKIVVFLLKVRLPPHTNALHITVTHLMAINSKFCTNVTFPNSNHSS